MFRSRTRGAGDEQQPGAEASDAIAPEAFDPRTVTGLFVAPKWLRDLGRSAWLMVGVTLAVVGTIWLLTLTQTIVAPLITAGVVATVASPLVRHLGRLHLGRGLAAALLLVLGIVLAVGVVYVVLAGIRSQFDSIDRSLGTAKETLTGWLTDLGVDAKVAADTRDTTSSALKDAIPALLNGLGNGIKQLSSLVFFLALTGLSLFFLLKDGPEIRLWAEGHMRVPRPMAHQISSRVLQALRGYFVGVTIVAAFNAVVVVIGALILGVPLAGTIAVITFLGAYVPYLGAWAAGAFSVLVALGGAGTDAAVGMIVVQLLANGILQQLVQPIALGAALGLHPLAVLVVTIAGGALFGAVGLILAAPLTAAVTRIATDISQRPAEPAPAPAAPAGAAAAT
jgi:predicted PurR-regulated permease PerM